MSTFYDLWISIDLRPDALARAIETLHVFDPPRDGVTELSGITTVEPFRRRGVATALTTPGLRGVRPRDRSGIFDHRE
jgi:hypothetical protein